MHDVTKGHTNSMYSSFTASVRASEHLFTFSGASHTALLLHAEMVGAGASMATHNNCIYVFGGMDEERAEHMYLWRWDLSSEAGFEPITHRYAGNSAEAWHQRVTAKVRFRSHVCAGSI